jgi:hypothetical protein
MVCWRSASPPAGTSRTSTTSPWACTAWGSPPSACSARWASRWPPTPTARSPTTPAATPRCPPGADRARAHRRAGQPGQHHRRHGQGLCHRLGRADGAGPAGRLRRRSPRRLRALGRRTWRRGTGERADGFYKLSEGFRGPKTGQTVTRVPGHAHDVRHPEIEATVESGWTFRQGPVRRSRTACSRQPDRGTANWSFAATGRRWSSPMRHAARLHPPTTTR